MWIVNEDGLYSITSGDPDNYKTFHAFTHERVVRGRDKASLVRMRHKLQGDKPEIVGPWPDADYRYRMKVDKYQLAHYLSDYARDMDYVSFKGGVGPRWERDLPSSMAHNRQVVLVNTWVALRDWSPPGWEDWPEGTVTDDTPQAIDT